MATFTFDSVAEIMTFHALISGRKEGSREELEAANEQVELLRQRLHEVTIEQERLRAKRVEVEEALQTANLNREVISTLFLRFMEAADSPVEERERFLAYLRAHYAPVDRIWFARQILGLGPAEAKALVV